MDQLIAKIDSVQAERVNSACLDTLPLAMAYVPMQKWGQVYEQEVAFPRGTIFPVLDLPFIGEEAVPYGCK